MWLAITAKLASSSCDVEGDPSTALRYARVVGEAVVTFPRPYDPFAERRARAHLEQVGRLCDDVSGRLWFAQLVVRGGQASQEEEEELSAVGRGEGRAFCAPPACDEANVGEVFRLIHPELRENLIFSPAGTPDELALDFAVLGVGKCGGSSLIYNLGLHPDLRIFY